MDKAETLRGGHFQAGAGIFVDAYAAIIQPVHNWLQEEHKKFQSSSQASCYTSPIRAVAFEDSSIGDWNRSSSNGETKSLPALHSFFDAALKV
jgi:hypothetical protein